MLVEIRMFVEMFYQLLVLMSSLPGRYYNLLNKSLIERVWIVPDQVIRSSLADRGIQRHRDRIVNN